MSTINKLAAKFEKKLNRKSKSGKGMSRQQLVKHLESLSNEHSSFRKALQKATADLNKAQADLEKASDMAESTRLEMEKYHKILHNMNLTGGNKMINRKDTESYVTDEGDVVVDGNSIVPYNTWKKSLKALKTSIPDEDMDKPSIDDLGEDDEFGEPLESLEDEDLGDEDEDEDEDEECDPRHGELCDCSDCIL